MPTKAFSLLNRSSGILLHPTSLPGQFGVGDFGPCAFDFVDFLQKSGQTWWQIFPFGPPGYGNSPYQPLSSFAGNPWLISLEDLIRHGFLRPSDVSNDHDPQSTQVNFLHIKTTKNKSFRLAFEKFKGSLADRRDPFRKFIAAQKHWLNDYALFSSLKKAH
jgi:4-alpha-glucanotransferase